MMSDDSIQGVLIDEVLGAEQLSDGSRALIVRSGGGMVGLVFSSEQAERASDFLNGEDPDSAQ
jgi:hypothetical protein